MVSILATESSQLPFGSLNSSFFSAFAAAAATPRFFREDATSGVSDLLRLAALAAGTAPALRFLPDFPAGVLGAGFPPIRFQYDFRDSLAVALMVGCHMLALPRNAPSRFEGDSG